MSLPTLTSVRDLTINIGQIPILVRTDNAAFAHMLADRYGEFVTSDPSPAVMELEVRLIQEAELGGGDAEFGEDPDADVSVHLESGRWVMERGDFHAEWDLQCRRGWVRQTANPYSIDGVLRILHSLILAREGGLLVHAASAVRNGRAFVFAGISGTGKTTLARLAPPDVTLLTDEISYVKQVTGNREQGTGNGGQVIQNWEQGAGNGFLSPVTCNLSPAFSAFGTPFAGELARIGHKVQAPLAGVFLLQQGMENRLEPIREGQAVRELMRHVLFFAQDNELVHMIFQTVCDLVRRVPVRRLVFTPDARGWELIV